MQKKSDIDMERLRIAKAIRTAINLKHRLAADRELNDVLPAVLEQFDRTVSAGQPYELNIGGVFDEV